MLLTVGDFKQLLDADSPLSQFDQELPDFLEHVWDEAKRSLDDAQLSTLATLWLQQRSGTYRKPPSEVTRGLIAAIAKRLTPSSQVLVDLLRAVMRIAPRNEVLGITKRMATTNFVIPSFGKMSVGNPAFFVFPSIRGLPVVINVPLAKSGSTDRTDTIQPNNV